MRHVSCTHQEHGNLDIHLEHNLSKTNLNLEKRTCLLHRRLVDWLVVVKPMRC